MDLYSDLPPAMSAISSQSIHDANKPSDSTNNNSTNINNNNNNNNVSTNTSVSGTKSNVSISFKPSSLQFKPRQTVASVHNNTSLNVNNKHQNHLAPLIPFISIGDGNNNNNNSSGSDNIKSTTTSSTSTYYPHPNNHNINIMSTIDNSKDEFNTNSSFDVSDPYDPKKPNDYIAYCSERLEKRRLKLLEEENKKHIEEMNKAREELELERKKAAEKGDYTFLMKSMQQQQQQGSRGVEDVIYSTMGVNSTNHSNANTGGGMNGSGSSSSGGGGGVGRGRGRGALTNLPAWMVDQMKDTTTHNQSDNNNNNNSSSISGDRQYADSNSISSGHISASTAGNDGIIKKRLVVKGGFSKPSCILLLKNMVGADDQEELNGLAIETQQECLKYGPISSCIVYVVDINDVDNDKKKKKYQSCPSHERVRTFICFERQDSAVRAYRDLNGRFFGGRQISASFYDEDKYARRDLAPDDVECSNFTSSSTS